MPRFSRATTYAPPDVSYAVTVWRYETTTIASRTAIAIEIGTIACIAETEAPTSTTSAASVAYATDDSGSDAKIGSASHFGSSVSSSSPVAIGRPTTTRFSRADRAPVSVACATAPLQRVERIGGSTGERRAAVDAPVHRPAVEEAFDEQDAARRDRAVEIGQPACEQQQLCTRPAHRESVDRRRAWQQATVGRVQELGQIAREIDPVLVADELRRPPRKPRGREPRRQQLAIRARPRRA